MGWVSDKSIITPSIRTLKSLIVRLYFFKGTYGKKSMTHFDTV